MGIMGVYNANNNCLSTIKKVLPHKKEPFPFADYDLF